MAILRDSVQHIGMSVISGDAISSYIPTGFNMFAMLEAMCDKLASNRIVHSVCPAFFTPVLYLYYSHVVYFHILRARALAGRPTLTRSEKLILSKYERVAPAESWPVAAPLIGFIQAMGTHKTEASYHSWVVPSLPDFSQLGNACGLGGLERVPGMLRLPIIPALQKLVHNFGTGAADFKDGIIHPVALLLSHDNPFIGISSSEADDVSFLAVTFNLCWNTPFETGADYLFNTDDKRRRISQWNVPDVPNNATLNTAESFLGFSSNHSFDWMRHLLATAGHINKFFPNSTTLSNIPPSATPGSLTHVWYHRAPPTALNDTWYYDRSANGEVTLSFKGFSKTQDGLFDTRLGIGASTNAEFPGYFPVDNARPDRKGPFFNEDDAECEEPREGNAVFLSEGHHEQDPASRYSLLITKYFDSAPIGITAK